MNISFRIAGKEDTDLLLKLIQEYYAFDGHPYNKQKIRPVIENLIDDSARGAIWIMGEQETAIGYMVLCLGYSLEYYGIDAFLDEIYIHEVFRSKGIGKQAMTFLGAECRTRNVRALHLEIERKNRKAQRFYRSTGFGDNDRRLMTKRLS